MMLHESTAGTHTDTGVHLANCRIHMQGTGADWSPASRSNRVCITWNHSFVITKDKYQSEENFLAQCIQENIRLIRTGFHRIKHSFSNLRRLDQRLEKAAKKEKDPFTNKKFLTAIQKAITETARQHPADTRINDLKKRVDAAMKQIQNAVKKLVEANQHLISMPSSRYHNREKAEDLRQEGIIGLITAAYKFNPARGCKFSTYAMYWVRQSMNRAYATMHSGPRLSDRTLDLKRRFHQTATSLAHRLGREASEEEIMQAAHLTSEESKMVQTHSASIYSLDAYIGNENEGSTFLDLLEDQNIKTPTVLAEKNNLIEAIRNAMKNLPDRKAKIIGLRYGIDKPRPHSLSEVAGIMGVTKERIRQIEVQAIRQLRHPANNLASHCA